jgi:hypothetical protein
MNNRLLSRGTTLFSLVALPMLTGPVKEAPLRHAGPGAQTLSVTPARADVVTQAKISSAYGRLSLSFEANQGQTDCRVKFLSRGKGYCLFLTSTEAVLALTKGAEDKRQTEGKTRRPGGSAGKDMATAPSQSVPPSALGTAHSAVVRMKLVGANPQPKVAGLEELPGKANYFLGNDPKRWRTNVPTYAKVKYQDVYPGIDMVYYGRQQQLEYDLVVAPGADPRSIRMSFEGADKLEINPQGDLILHTAAGEVVQHPPKFTKTATANERPFPAGMSCLGPKAQRPASSLRQAGRSRWAS